MNSQTHDSPRVIWKEDISNRSRAEGALSLDQNTVHHLLSPGSRGEFLIQSRCLLCTPHFLGPCPSRSLAAKGYFYSQSFGDFISLLDIVLDPNEIWVQSIPRPSIFGRQMLDHLQLGSKLFALR